MMANKKKVGILTFHIANNHGAILQCYALQEVLKKIGYDVEVIDYKQPHIKTTSPPFSIRRLISLLLHPRALYGYIKSIPYRLEKNKNFDIFRNKYLNISSSSYSRNTILHDIDTYVIGSDQVWSLHCTNGLDPVYFGDFKRKDSSKIIGYAISSNLKSIDTINEVDLTKYVNNFDILSFREQSISDAVLAKCGKHSRVDVDPTLLTDATLWDKMIDAKWADRKYILLYQVRGSKETRSTLKRKAEEQAKLLGCEVVNLGDPKYSPIDFVSAFKYAQCVITSSFHASVFSVIFERPLQAVMLNDGHDGRYVNILKAIGAENMLVDINFKPVIKNYDYVQILSRLENLRKYSIDYLITL